MTTPKPVVVGVDGSPRDTASIRYGAHQARRDGCPLLLVHVVPTLVLATLSPLSTPVTPIDLEDAGRGVLRRAVAVARTVLPDSEISTRLLLGQVAPHLVDAAADARLLVLGDDRMPAVERLVVGSVVASVAAHAPVGVVSVPSGWAESTDDGGRRILVGVKDYERVPREVLRASLALAQHRGATLELAHVWDLPGVYGEIVASVLDYPDWQAMVERHLRADVDAVRDAFPDVVVEISAWFGQPAHVLRQRSADADLLVLTRKAHGFPFGHFGATGRALLRESACPVEVLPINETAPLDEPAGREPAAT